MKELRAGVVMFSTSLLLCSCHPNRSRNEIEASLQGTGPIPRRVEEKGELLIARGRLDEALDLLRPYAETGNAEAQFGMSVILDMSAGERAERKAEHSASLAWLRKAAAQGHQHALETLADAYERGWYNLPTNQVMAVMWRNAARETNRIPECLGFESNILSGNQILPHK